MPYIYLVQEREFLNKKEDTYKIGRTDKTPQQRMAAYPKGSEVILFRYVSNSQKVEKDLIEIFKQKFKHMKEYGNEYFGGDANEMVMMISIYVYYITSTIPITDILNNIPTPREDHMYIENEKRTLVKTFDKYIENENRTLVKTFDKYTEINGDLFLIVITKKKTCEGYIKIRNDNQCWERLSSTSDNDENSLEDFLMAWSNDDNDEEYDFEQIKKDICNKFYQRPPIFYELKYHEFVVCQGVGRSTVEDKIYDIVEDTYKDIPTDKIVCGFRSTHILCRTDKEIKTDIVDTILHTYVTDTHLLEKFRQLCIRIFAKKSSTPYIFDDYGHYPRLTSWLDDVVLAFTDYTILDYNHYQAFPEEYKQDIKQNKYRAACIDKRKMDRTSRTIINTITTKLTKMGINNIIIINAKIHDKKYDKGKLKTFLAENKQLVEANFICEIDKDMRYTSDELFHSPNFLFPHFVRWCVSKAI